VITIDRNTHLAHGDAGVDRLFGRFQRVLIKRSWSKIETRA
jgi:hypothetical protein